MSNERELTKNMKAQLKRNGVVASLKDYETRKNHLIDINDGFHNVLDYIPDFIMINLLKEYTFSFSFKNMDEFAEGILGYKHGNVQVMRTIARHFFVFNPDTKEYELDNDFRDYDSTQLERMAELTKEELLDIGIVPSMTVNEIDAIVRENGLQNSLRVSDEESKILNAYRNADDDIKAQVKKLLKQPCK